MNESVCGRGQREAGKVGKEKGLPTVILLVLYADGKSRGSDVSRHLMDSKLFKSPGAFHK